MDRSSKTLQLAHLFAALADPTRLRLLNLMNGREVCVCYFVEILKQSQPKISRHLAYLRKAGIVNARRDGKWMHYRLKKLEASREKILSETLHHLGKEPQIKKDWQRLKQGCC